MSGEEGVRRRREAGPRELIERLNSEEQPLSREEVEERERRAEEAAPKEKYDWFFLAALSSVAIVFGLAAGVETYYAWPGPIGLWAGALSVHAASRYLGWGRPVLRSIWAASFVGWVVMAVVIPFLIGEPIFPLLYPASIVYSTVAWFLSGVWIIAGARARRLTHEESRV